MGEDDNVWRINVHFVHGTLCAIIKIPELTVAELKGAPARFGGHVHAQVKENLVGEFYWKTFPECLKTQTDTSIY